MTVFKELHKNTIHWKCASLMHVPHITFYNNVVGDALYDFSIHWCLNSLTYSSQVIVQLASGLLRQETNLILSLSYMVDERKDRQKLRKIMRHIVWKELELIRTMFYAQYHISLCTLVLCSTTGQLSFHYNCVQCYVFWYNEVTCELFIHFIFNIGPKN